MQYGAVLLLLRIYEKYDKKYSSVVALLFALIDGIVLYCSGNNETMRSNK